MRNRVLAAAAVVACAAVPFVVAAQDSLSGLQQAQARAQADTGVGRYYTAAQAVRGKELFNRHCAYCHYVDPANMPTMSGVWSRIAARRRRPVSASTRELTSMMMACNISRPPTMTGLAYTSISRGSPLER